MLREREQLLALLETLSPSEWRQQTQVPGWCVKDIALHILDDDLSVLARNRDGDESGLINADDHQSLVLGLAAKNQRWIDGAQQLSSRLIIDLLAWSGDQVIEYYETVADGELSHVSWASDEPVPVWLDVAREFTERWVHQVQVREATERLGQFVGEHLPLVLRTFVWAFPHQYRADSDEGTTVQIDLTSGGIWTLTSQGRRTWSFAEGATASSDASASFGDDAGWRVLTAAAYPAEQVTLSGPPHLVEPLLDVRSIIV
jgi:uncharacterized protein (TIGR03083 family)